MTRTGDQRPGSRPHWSPRQDVKKQQCPFKEIPQIFHQYALPSDALFVSRRPHPLKTEPVMLESRVSPIRLESTSVPVNRAEMAQCTQRFDVPGLVFSTGGYNGNNFHTFIEGVVPLFITARHYGGEVVLMISDSHDWWLAKFKAYLQGGQRACWTDPLHFVTIPSLAF